MKKFKNQLFVKGPLSLLKAFVEELKKIGYTDQIVIDDLVEGISLQTNRGDSSGRYIFTHKTVREPYQLVHVISLPDQWHLGLKLASECEVVVPEYIKCKKSHSDEFTKGRIYKTKVNTSTERFYNVYKDDSGESNGWQSSNFLPSTKEEYEAQENAKPKIGKWYKSNHEPHDKMLAYCQELKSDGGFFGYGFNGFGEYRPPGTSFFGGCFKSNAVLASETDVEFALMKHARAIYPIDSLVRCVENPNDVNRIVNFIGSGDTIYSNGLLLFKKGIWAKPIKQFKMNGHSIEKINDTTIKIGCAEFQMNDIHSMYGLLSKHKGFYTKDGVHWAPEELKRIIDIFTELTKDGQ